MNTLQCRRHVAQGNAIGKTLDHRRLANAGLSSQNRIVLTPPHQNVDHLADLLVAAQHRINLSGFGIRSHVYRVLIQMRGRTL